ncbi:MAG: hypothetical protein V1709_00825 [Planctomycetota bacterium]
MKQINKNIYMGICRDCYHRDRCLILKCQQATGRGYAGACYLYKKEDINEPLPEKVRVLPENIK